MLIVAFGMLILVVGLIYYFIFRKAPTLTDNSKDKTFFKWFLDWGNSGGSGDGSSGDGGGGGSGA